MWQKICNRKKWTMQRMKILDLHPFCGFARKDQLPHWFTNQWSMLKLIMTCLQTVAENFKVFFSKQDKALLCTVLGNSADFRTDTWHAHITSTFNFMCYRHKESCGCDSFLYRTALNNTLIVSTRSYINMRKSFTSWFT